MLFYMLKTSIGASPFLAHLPSSGIFGTMSVDRLARSGQRTAIDDVAAHRTCYPPIAEAAHVTGKSLCWSQFKTVEWSRQRLSQVARR